MARMPAGREQSRPVSVRLAGNLRVTISFAKLGPFRIHQTKRECEMLRMTAKLVMLAVCLTVLAGCNTIAGAGKDVQKVGEKVEEKAQDCKDAKC
jgi:entericidin A